MVCKGGGREIHQGNRGRSNKYCKKKIKGGGPDTRRPTYGEGNDNYEYVGEVRSDKKGGKCLEETTRGWLVHRQQSQLGCRGT